MKWLCADKQLQLVAVCLAAPQLLCIQNCRAYEYISNSFPFFFHVKPQCAQQHTRLLWQSILVKVLQVFLLSLGHNEGLVWSGVEWSVVVWYSCYPGNAHQHQQLGKRSQPTPAGLLLWPLRRLCCCHFRISWRPRAKLLPLQPRLNICKSSDGNSKSMGGRGANCNGNGNSNLWKSN